MDQKRMRRNNIEVQERGVGGDGFLLEGVSEFLGTLWTMHRKKGRRATLALSISFPFPMTCITPAANRKTENSRIAPDSSEASRDCMTSPRTQDKVIS
ncbi:hypothetical protein ACH5RR_008755 [Cinchona calisaya]|uniref:Uncharacterized protein n=1 Tax=Cinchona calisaya TaxID=153742 RepID=A0ABD3AE47_9GENT